MNVHDEFSRLARDKAIATFRQWEQYDCVSGCSAHQDYSDACAWRDYYDANAQTIRDGEHELTGGAREELHSILTKRSPDNIPRLIAMYRNHGIELPRP